MTRQSGPEGAAPQRGGWHHCPRCRYPMLPWAELRGEQERVWVDWNPQDWWIGPPALALAVLGLLMMLPSLDSLALPALLLANMPGERWTAAVMAVGLGLAWLWGLVRAGRRQRRRRWLAQRLRDDDLVCPKCLHVPNLHALSGSAPTRPPSTDA